MYKFAKIFGPDDNQILAMLRPDDNGIFELAIYYGITNNAQGSIVFHYDSNEKALMCFEQVTEEELRELVKNNSL